MIFMLPVRDVFVTNCYFDIDDATGHGFLIDPGTGGEKLVRLIRKKGWTIEQILLTHGHFDHFGGAAEVQRRLSIPLLMHADGKRLAGQPEQNLSSLFGPARTVDCAAYFRDGDVLSLREGRVALEVLHTPGHTLDSVTLYDRAANTAFVGDTLFKGSPGEDHYPTGDRTQLLHSIRDVILRLPEDTSLLSGHSMPTTVGAERALYL